MITVGREVKNKSIVGRTWDRSASLTSIELFEPTRSSHNLRLAFGIDFLPLFGRNNQGRRLHLREDKIHSFIIGNNNTMYHENTKGDFHMVMIYYIRYFNVCRSRIC